MSTILIMDEEKAIRMLFAYELSEEGYEVIACGDPSGLMELIRDSKPDLLVMEVFLHNHDGLALLQDISHAFRELPVILCTTCPAFREDLRSLAAHGFVVKGSNLKPLKAAVTAVLEGRAVPRPHDERIPEPMARVSFPWQEVR